MIAMAFRTQQITVNGATQLFVAQAGDVEVTVEGVSGVYLGGDNTVDETGLSLSTDHFRTKVRPGDELWAYRSSGIYVSILVRSA